MQHRGAAGIAFLGALFLSGCFPKPAPLSRERPSSENASPPMCPGCNLILIDLCNVSAGRMSLYGYPRQTTPRLDEWAKHAVVFDHFFTHASWTLPVGVSLFTSMYPYAHKVLSPDVRNTISPDIQTLPEILRDHGYRTTAFTGSLHYYVGFSHMRGFQDPIDNPGMSKFSLVIPEAKDWLAKNSDRKFMLFLQAYDVHCPLKPSEPYKGTFSDPKGKNVTVDATRCVRGFKNSTDYTAFYAGPPQRHKRGQTARLTQDDIDYLSDLYDDRILDADALVGQFLQSLKEDLLRKTIVVVFSDHGEMFGKHGKRGRFGRVGTTRGTHYDDVLHVPLIIRFPDGNAKRISGLAQIIDIMPTLLRALGLSPPPTAEGGDLAPLIRDGTPVNRYAYAGASYNYELLTNMVNPYGYWTQTDSIRDLRWKLIEEAYYRPLEVKRMGLQPKPVEETMELYDITRDPEELRNLSKEQPDIAADLLAKLKSWKQETLNFSPSAPTTKKVPEELLKKARGLGYWQ